LRVTLSKSELLAQINEGLPDLDWKQGARDYVAAFCAQYTPEQIEDFIFTKPLAAVTPEDPAGALLENASYLFNFASAIRLLNLPRGARVLDVACGGGWFSHWLRKIGYDARGVDISEDFVKLARKRLVLDPHLAVDESELEAIYRVHDLELGPLPADFEGSCDAVVLESCLHHFYDPITALDNIRRALAPGGVVLILEGENRRGPIREEYLKVMLETATLERPYPREQLVAILQAAGLGHVEFLGSTPGFFAESAPVGAHMTQYLADSTQGANVCICAVDADSLRRVVPSYTGPRAGRGAAPPPAAPEERFAAGADDSVVPADAPAAPPGLVAAARDEGVAAPEEDRVTAVEEDVAAAPQDARLEEVDSAPEPSQLRRTRPRLRSPVHPRAALLAAWRAFWGPL
jgi:SAM-dependent methyltransferase